MRSVRVETKQLGAMMILSTLLLTQAVRAAAPTEAVRVAEIMLLYQRDNGGWPKNYDEDQVLTEAT
ncbi:MAG: hypothetical protein GY842_05125, partial [bacterium]|nr:hypothetical protein [bacterium]